MQKRIFRNLFLIAFTSVLLGAALIVSALYGVFTRRLRQELKSEAGYVAAGLEQAGTGIRFLRRRRNPTSRASL
jgi:hypothetical protein